SKEDPVEAVEAFAGRVYGVHVKDVKNATQFTILGAGDLRLPELLKALARQKYEYCLALEYEENPDNPIDDIRACFKAFISAMPTYLDRANLSAAASSSSAYRSGYRFGSSGSSRSI